ncbi:glycosyltransferase family 2 protein [Algibacter pectinivorans]|uniref:Glycosyltransferase involved in cell wall bisynthesis n=1 Tax=Algibacter pectinivorans TaxID=870482 RepID=A0A1I1NY81_9FLAO|nr:glycosyltransferase family 2 protein [Algibacter pectinivorans]SFD02559.1 Glycosyltransferase involved in cell wall bisynthesis [Algibacter pectinivorans]
MKCPLVSIIIPTYNRAHIIGDTLNSILNQTYANWECIVINDHSTDSTLEIVNKFVKKDNRFSCYNLENGYLKGGNGARNYGFKLSQGDYVNWFDDDDVMLDNFLKSRIEAFTSSVNFVIGSHYTVNQNLENKTLQSLEIKSYLFKDYALWKLQLITNSILFRKSFLSEKILFNENLKRGQETELFTRLFFRARKESYKIINVPLFLYRQHETSKTQKNLSYVDDFQESKSIVSIQILKKSIKLRDSELVNIYYYNLINTFFKSLEKNHKVNSKYILDNLSKILRPNNSMLSFEIKIFGSLFLFISRGIYKFEKRWKSKTIKI